MILQFAESISAVTQILEGFEEKSLTNNAHLAKPRLECVFYVRWPMIYLSLVFFFSNSSAIVLLESICQSEVP